MVDTMTAEFLSAQKELCWYRYRRHLKLFLSWSDKWSTPWIAKFLSAQKELLAQVKTKLENVAIKERMMGIIIAEFLSAKELLGQVKTTFEPLLSWHKRW